MITIRITQTIETTKQETQNFLTSKTPTDKRKEKDYGSGTELAYDEKYVAKEVNVTTTKTIELLEQTIVDESSFDLGAVIKAVNNL